MAAPVYICTTDAALGDSLETLLAAHGIDAATHQGALSGVLTNRLVETVIVDLDMDVENLFRDIDFVMNKISGPRLILLAGNRHGFDASDSFHRPHVTLLLPPIDPRQIVTLLQKEPVTSP